MSTRKIRKGRELKHRRERMSVMEMFMSYGGQEIGRSEFGSDLRDKIAYDICFYSGIGCGSKEKALEMLYSAADSIIEQVTDHDKP